MRHGWRGRARCRSSCGWLVTGFYPDHNLIAGSHQRCCEHLLHDLHELKTAYAADTAVLDWT